MYMAGELLSSYFTIWLPNHTTERQSCVRKSIFMSSLQMLSSKSGDVNRCITLIIVVNFWFPFLIFCQKFPMVFPEPDHTFILFLLQFLYRPFTKMPPCCDFFSSSLYFLSSVMSISLLHFIKLVNKFTLESATDKVCSVCFIRPWCGKAWLTAMRFLTN